MRCLHCGAELAPDDRFCGECGAPRPQVPPRFTQVEGRFAALRARYEAGELDHLAYETELRRLVIEDDAGEFWMLGADSGEWYWYDGERWVRRSPVSPEDVAESPRPRQPTPAQPVDDGRPPVFPQWGWVAAGCGGLVILLVVVGGGALIASNWLRQARLGHLSTETAVEVGVTSAASAVAATSTPSPMSSSAVAQAATQPAEPTATLTREPTSTPTLSPSAPFSMRPYDPDRDADVEGVVERVVDFAGATEPGVREWDVTFPADAPALISLGWCAADQPTLDDNWSQLAYELQIDGFSIGLSQLAEMTWRSAELFCRGYQGVLTGWDQESHSIEWRQRVRGPINDGITTYPAGDYVLRFEVEMVNMLEDEFSDASGGWPEEEYAVDRIWIEGGEYHVVIKEPQRIAQIAHKRDRYADFYLSVSGRLFSDTGGQYGVMFRYQDPDNYYYFRISHEGRYRIGKRQNGEWIDLVKWTFSDAINKAQSENTLWLICEGDSIVAFVNQQEVASLTDDTFARGYVGLMAGSFDQADAHVAFDYIVVEAMSQE